MVRQGGDALQRRARNVGDVDETLIHHPKNEKNTHAFNARVGQYAPKQVSQFAACSALVQIESGDGGVVPL